MAWLGHGIDQYSHLWSLAVEAQFYLLFPLRIFYTPWKYLKGLISVMILTGVISRLLACAAGHNEVYTKVITTSCLDSLGLGAILAYFSLYQKETLLKWIGNKWFVGFCLSLFSINLTIVLTGDPDEDVPLLCSIPLNFFYSVCSCLLIGIVCFGSLGGMTEKFLNHPLMICLLYTSDAADERSSVDLGGRRIIKKKNSIRLGSIKRVEEYNRNKYSSTVVYR